MEWVKWLFVGILIAMLTSVLVLFIKVKRWDDERVASGKAKRK